MTLAELHARRIPNRTITGMAAMLLPFNEDGSIADEAYASLMEETFAAGLTPAVNMDTGYANLLSDGEKALVLGVAQEAAKGRQIGRAHF